MKIIGSLIERARAGEALPDRHFNPYLLEAADLENYLFTPSRLTSGEKAADCESTLDSVNDSIEQPVFQPIFQDSRPLFVEVGTYMGKNLIEMAQSFPDMNFLGLDITYKRTVKTAKKIKNLGLSNAKAGICDARPFFAAQGNESVDGVCIFFPDPWPKLRHAKKRLISASFLAELERVLKPNGFFWFKTDALFYFDAVCELTACKHWAIESSQSPSCTSSQSFAVSPSEFCGKDFLTAFESLFQRKGEATYGRVFRRPKAKS